MNTLWRTEPAALLGLVQAGLALAVGFGVPLTTQQMGLLMAFTSAVVAVVVRSQVIPVKGA